MERMKISVDGPHSQSWAEADLIYIPSYFIDTHLDLTVRKNK